MLEMVGRSRILGVPRLGDKEMSDNLDTVQSRASQTSQAFVHGRRLEVIPFEACKRDSSRDGGSVLYEMYHLPSPEDPCTTTDAVYNYFPL